MDIDIKHNTHTVPCEKSKMVSLASSMIKKLFYCPLGLDFK